MSPRAPKMAPRRPKTTPRWPQDGPKRAQNEAKMTQDGPKTGRGTTAKSCKILFGALLGPSWGHLGSTWAQLGTSKPILKPTWHPSSCFQTLKTTRRPPSSHFAIIFKACCLQKSAKNIDLALQTTTTKSPKNQITNPQALGVGSAERAERLNKPS